MNSQKMGSPLSSLVAIIAQTVSFLFHTLGMASFLVALLIYASKQIPSEYSHAWSILLQLLLILLWSPLFVIHTIRRAHSKKLLAACIGWGIFFAFMWMTYDAEEMSLTSAITSIICVTASILILFDIYWASKMSNWHEQVALVVTDTEDPRTTFPEQLIKTLNGKWKDIEYSHAYLFPKTKAVEKILALLHQIRSEEKRWVNCIVLFVEPEPSLQWRKNNRDHILREYWLIAITLMFRLPQCRVFVWNDGKLISSWKILFGAW